MFYPEGIPTPMSPLCHPLCLKLRPPPRSRARLSSVSRASEPLRTFPNQSEPFRTPSELGSSRLGARPSAPDTRLPSDPDYSRPIRADPDQSDPFRTRSELGSRVPPHFAGQPIPAGKETVKFRSSAVRFRPVLTSVVKPGQGRKFFAGEKGKETVKLFLRHRPLLSVHLQSPICYLEASLRWFSGK